MTCTEDGVLLTKCGKPAKVFRKELHGRWTSAPRVEFVGEDGLRHTMAVSKLVEAARTGVAPKLGWAKSSREKHAASQRAWDRRTLAAMRADPGNPRHGTVVGYKVGCRCQRCRNANRLDEWRHRLRKRMGELGVNPYTGTPSS